MKKLTLLCVLLLVAHVSPSQELESILLAAREDANKLAKGYMNPVMSGLIYGMNSGWYHTAKAHKKLGFDVTIGFNASMVPSKDEVFDIANLGLTSITAPGSSLTPTVAGTGDGAMLNVNANVQGQAVTASFQMPDGVSDDLPLGAVPTPALQVGVGLPFKFDVMLRAVPKVGSDDVKAGLFGIGLKKEITDIFGPMDKTPLHVAVLAAYTNMNVDYNIDGDAIPGQNQSAEFKLNSFTLQAIGSLNFPIINIYGGIGYTGGSSSLTMLGTYDLQYTPIAAGPTITETVTDPLDLDFDASGFRTTLGVRLSLGFFKLFGDYTLQKYNTLSAGMAFSFR